MEKLSGIPLKILTLGHQSVGKSSLILRYCRNTFSSSTMSTIGLDFICKYVTIDSEKVKLSIWDTSGQEKFKCVVKSFFKGADGFLVVYSIDDRQSFEKITFWLQSIKDNCNNINSQIILIGNKCDVNNRIVSFQEGQDMANRFNINFYETSAKDGTNVEKAVLNLAQISLQQKKEQLSLQGEGNQKSINLNDQTQIQPKKIKKNCC